VKEGPYVYPDEWKTAVTGICVSQEYLQRSDRIGSHLRGRSQALHLHVADEAAQLGQPSGGGPWEVAKSFAGSASIVS
jgi:hypothetical protein